MRYVSPSAAIAESGAAARTSARAAARAAFTASQPAIVSDGDAGKTTLFTRDIKPPHVLTKLFRNRVGLEPPLFERVIIAAARVFRVAAPPLVDGVQYHVRGVDPQACKDLPQRRHRIGNQRIVVHMNDPRAVFAAVEIHYSIDVTPDEMHHVTPDLRRVDRTARAQATQVE